MAVSWRSETGTRKILRRTPAERWCRAATATASTRCESARRSGRGRRNETPDAFALLGVALDRRLNAGRLTVVDATNLKREDGLPLAATARARSAPMVAIVFDLPVVTLEARRIARADRRLPAEALARQIGLLRDAVPALASQGFDRVYVLGSAAAVDGARVLRQRRDGPAPCRR